MWCLRQVTLTLRLFLSQWQNYLTEMLWERQKDAYKLPGQTQNKHSIVNSHDFYCHASHFTRMPPASQHHNFTLISTARRWQAENTNCPDSQKAPVYPKDTSFCLTHRPCPRVPPDPCNTINACQDFNVICILHQDHCATGTSSAK